MREGERGSALVWTMLVLVAVGSVTSLLLQRSRTLEAQVETERAAARALYAAEGALERARHELVADPTYAGGTLAVGRCTVRLVVERAEGRWLVHAVATPGGCRLDAELAAGPGLPRLVAWRRS